MRISDWSSDVGSSDLAANRKRYKGAFNPDILGYQPETHEFRQYTDYEGKDFWQSVDRQGNVFFASDQASGEYNLYTLSGGQKKALTRFETSVKRPFVSANGEKVVFENDYHIFVFKVSSGKTPKPEISLSRNPVLGNEQEFNVEGHVSGSGRA